jgi:hypothetical protein
MAGLFTSLPSGTQIAARIVFSLIPCYSRERATQVICHLASIPSAPLRLRRLVGRRRKRGTVWSTCGVHTPYLLPRVRKVRVSSPRGDGGVGYCHLVFVSGLSVGFSTLLGGDLEVFFCFLLGESKCGAGLVVVVGARFVRLVFSSLLAIGVDKIRVGGVAGDGGSCFLLWAPIGVEMLLFPFGGLKLQVISSAGDGRCFFWAGNFGSEGARSRLFLLLRAATLKLLMFFQGFRCALAWL